MPFGVGLTVSWPLLADNLWAILVSAVLSTLVVLAVAGRTFQSLNRRR